MQYAIKAKRQQIQRQQQHGEMLLAMPEVMFKVIALGFQDVVTFILGFPSRSASAGDFSDPSLRGCLFTILLVVTILGRDERWR